MLFSWLPRKPRNHSKVFEFYRCSLKHTPGPYTLHVARILFVRINPQSDQLLYFDVYRRNNHFISIREFSLFTRFRYSSIKISKKKIQQNEKASRIIKIDSRIITSSLKSKTLQQTVQVSRRDKFFSGEFRSRIASRQRSEGREGSLRGARGFLNGA